MFRWLTLTLLPQPKGWYWRAPASCQPMRLQQQSGRGSLPSWRRPLWQPSEVTSSVSAMRMSASSWSYILRHQVQRWQQPMLSWSRKARIFLLSKRMTHHICPSRQVVAASISAVPEEKGDISSPEDDRTQMSPLAVIAILSWWSFSSTIPCLNGRCSVNVSRANGAEANASPCFHADWLACFSAWSLKSR